MPTIRPIVVSADLDRLVTFYTELLGATEVTRFPVEGPVFYVSLALGDSEVGLAANASAGAGDTGRVLLSVDVPDVDALLPRVEALGGTGGEGANDMPWGERVAHIKDPDGNAVNLTQTL